MKNYLMILPSDLMGGAEYNVLKCARHISTDKGNAVTVVFLSKKEVDVSRWCDLKSVNFVYMPVSREILGVFCFLFFCLFRFNVKYDFGFTSHTHCNAYISLLRLLGVLKVNKLILRESTNVFSWFKGYKKFLIKLFYSFYSLDATVICQTPRMKNELLENIPRLRRSDVRVVVNPVDIYSILASANDERNMISFDSDVVNIVAVGRLVEEKGFDILIDAVSKLSLNFRLYLVGGGDLEFTLKKQAKKLGVDDSVVFLGKVLNPFPYMKYADVCVVSSRLEGFPNTLLEMMVLSNRVITTLCADGLDKIPGVFTCPIDDSVSLKNKIEESVGVRGKALVERKEKMLSYVNCLDVKTFVDKVFFYF